MQLFRSALIAALAATALFAQPPAPPQVNRVLATLTLKPGVTGEQIAPVMPKEVRDTVQLYLDGKIEQWYARGDGKGVVFLLDCASVEEAKALLEPLPLAKGNFATFEYMTLGPLTPLRYLMTPPPAPAH